MDKISRLRWNCHCSHFADSGLVERNNGPEATWTLQQEKEKEGKERKEIRKERWQERKEVEVRQK